MSMHLAGWCFCFTYLYWSLVGLVYCLVSCLLFCWLVLWYLSVLCFFVLVCLIVDDLFMVLDFDIVLWLFAYIWYADFVAWLFVYDSVCVVFLMLSIVVSFWFWFSCLIIWWFALVDLFRFAGCFDCSV